MTTATEEQETTIVIMRNDPEAKIYTCDDTFKTRIRRAGHVPYKTEGDGEFYKITKRLVSIRSKLGTGRVQTPAQIIAFKERMQRIRQDRVKSQPALQLPESAGTKTTGRGKVAGMAKPSVPATPVVAIAPAAKPTTRTKRKR